MFLSALFLISQELLIATAETVNALRAQTTALFEGGYVTQSFNLLLKDLILHGDSEQGELPHHASKKIIHD